MPLILGANSVTGGYEVDNSLRFDDGSSDYLSRTLGSGDTQKWTISFWTKKMMASGSLLSVGTSGNYDMIYFNANKFAYYSATGGADDFFIYSEQVFRDSSAWYHIVLALDTTQATSSNRAKLYVNGEQVTTFDAQNVYPSQNFNVRINSSSQHNIGNRIYSSDFNFDGHISEFVNIDGQQLDPTSFGEFDEDSGIWKPIAYEGTYGTNGFFLEFKDSSALGDDTSNNSNDFTVNNLTSIDQSTDTPTNNFATMNPLAAQGGSSAGPSGVTFSNGNLEVGSVIGETAIGNLGVDTGKWFWEVKVLTDQDGLAIGGANQYYNLDAELGYNSPSSPSDAKVFGYYGGNGTKFITIGDGSQFTSYGSAIAVNNIVGVALDLDGNQVTFYLDGVTQGTFSITALGSGELYFPAVGNWSASAITTSFNFGSPSYAANGYTDGNGFGDFSYAVPSGYYALNTKNLAEYG
jgi:hypothetical protein